MATLILFQKPHRCVCVRAVYQCRMTTSAHNNALWQKRCVVYHTNSLDDHEQWYVAYCMPLKEQHVATVLSRSLSETYLPLIRRRVDGKQTYGALFPRYVFLHVNLSMVRMSQIRATPGLLRLVACGDTPQPIPASVIELLRQQVNQINAQGGLPAHAFQPGDAVRFTKGPLHGLHAVFTGPMHPTERVHVLLDFLGRLNEVEVAVHQLERAGPAAPPQPERRERRTRGKGRVITQTT